MENNDPNLNPQPTGGLKLMTVFIAVLALHVVVIGGFTVWHLLNPATTDADLALDKTHKGKIVTDSTIGEGSASDTATIDKPTSTDNPMAPTSGTDATTDSTVATTPAATATATAATPAPATASARTAPLAPTPITPPSVQPPPAMSEDTTVTTTAPAASVPSGPIHHGPVVTPPDNLAPPDDATTAATTPSASSVAADAPAPSADGTPYTVRKGDSLAKIAKHHHVSLVNLRSANSLASDSLHIGQKLVIPSGKKTLDEMATSTPAPAPETTAAAPATTPTESADVPEAPDASSTAAAVPASAPAARQSLAAEPRVASTATPRHHKTVASHHLYTVVKGDTLTKIAKRYHTTTSALIAANGIANAGHLSIGQRLHIPAHESRAAAAAQEAAPAEETAPRSSAKGQLANYVQ